MPHQADQEEKNGLRVFILGIVEAKGKVRGNSETRRRKKKKAGNGGGEKEV